MLPPEAEELNVISAEGVYDTQDMLPYGPDWSRNRQLRFEASAIGAVLMLQLPKVDFSGWYHFECVMTQAPDGAVIELAVNDKLLFPSIDLYSEKTSPNRYRPPFQIFLHASEEPRLVCTVKGKNEKSRGYIVGIDAFELSSPPQIPQTLLIQGPYYLEKKPEHPNPRVIRTADGNSILLGYGSARAAEEEKQELSYGTKTGNFALGALLKAASMGEGLFLVTCRLEPQRPGIYRFEIEPSESTPFLLQEESGRITFQKNRILANGVPLHGEETIRFDSQTERILPTRFHMPLQSGDNTISWMVRCNRNATVLPYIYGLEAE